MMISSWRRRRAARLAGKQQDKNSDGNNMELTIPSHFRCPISLDLMKDPVTLSTGVTYDRETIEKWIEAGNFRCPTTNQVLESFESVPNRTILRMIQDWCVENRSYGIERIPTPRIPVSSAEVSEVLSKVTVACKEGDQVRCRDLVAKLKGLANESERNRKRITTNGSASVLAEAFEAFSTGALDENVAVLEEILSTLTMVFPFHDDAKAFLGTSSSMHCIIWFLSSGDLSRRTNAVLVLKELVSSNQRKVNEVLEIEGAIEALFKMIKEPICPSTTKASLTIIYKLVTSPCTSENVLSTLVHMELVLLLLETLVESERSICEKALGILEGICTIEEGREAVSNNALGIPVLVRKLLRVSNLSTELSVSILCKLCKMEKSEDCGGVNLVVNQALQAGAFQKLLLLLQVGCEDRTKDKVTEVLKLLNLYRDRMECIDSLDFRDLKRPL
ncbi:hypothetical protein SLE2022_085460 [Rubroshorea leprosula]